MTDDTNKTQFLECVAEMRDLLDRQQPNRDQLKKNLERFMQERLPESALELGRRILGILTDNYTNIVAIEAKRIFKRLPDGPESTELLARLDTMKAHFEEVSRLVQGVNECVQAVNECVQGVDTRVEHLHNDTTRSFQTVNERVQGVDTRVEHLHNDTTRSFQTVNERVQGVNECVQRVDHRLDNDKQESKQFSTVCGVSLVVGGGILMPFVAVPAVAAFAFSVPFFYYGQTK